jgi:hypothetical protein
MFVPTYRIVITSQHVPVEWIPNNYRKIGSSISSEYFSAVHWIAKDDDSSIVGASSHFSSIDLQNQTLKSKSIGFSL